MFATLAPAVKQTTTQITPGVKIARARKAQRPRVTQPAAAVLCGMDLIDYKAAEYDRSTVQQKIAVSILAPLWGIPEEYFWSEQDSEPYTETPLTIQESLAGYDSIDDLIKIPLYVPSDSGYIAIWDHPSNTTPVPPGLAQGGAFAIVIPDIDMAPRFLPGNLVICRRQNLYEDGAYVVAENPAEQVVGPDGSKRPRLYLRWYKYEDRRFILKARNPNAPSFEASTMNIVGLVVGVKIVYADDWYTLEARNRGLPFDPPRGP